MKYALTSDKGKLIAYWQDLAAYYRDDKGVMWSYQRSWSCLGSITNDVLAKRYRVTAFLPETNK